MALNMLALFLIGWNALQPADGRKHPEENRELSMLWDSALAKNRDLRWIETSRQIIEGYFTRLICDAIR